MIALLLIAYGIGLWLGETLQDSLFPATHRNHKLYSGLFILLNLKPTIPKHDFATLSLQAATAFSCLIQDFRILTDLQYNSIASKLPLGYTMMVQRIFIKIFVG